MKSAEKSQVSRLLSSPRKRGSSGGNGFWIPAYAGMTLIRISQQATIRLFFLTFLISLSFLFNCAGRGSEPSTNFGDTTALAGVPKPESKTVTNEGDKKPDSLIVPGPETRPESPTGSTAPGFKKSIATGEIKVRLSGRWLAPLPIESTLTITLSSPEIQAVELAGMKINGHEIANESIRFSGARLDQAKSDSLTLVFQADFALQMAKEDLALLLSDPDLKSIFEELTSSMDVVSGTLLADFVIDRPSKKGKVDFSVQMDSPLANDVSLQIAGNLHGIFEFIYNIDDKTKRVADDAPKIEPKKVLEPVVTRAPQSPVVSALPEPDPKSFFNFQCDVTASSNDLVQFLPGWVGKSSQLIFDTQKTILNSDFRFIQDIKFPTADEKPVISISHISPYILPANGDEPEPFDVQIKKESYESDCVQIDPHKLRVLFSGIRIGFSNIELDLLVRGYFPIEPSGSFHLFSTEENQQGYYNVMAILSNVDASGALANPREVAGLRVQWRDSSLVSR